jgi:hypothetical protein
MRLQKEIPPGTWMFVYCECCVLLGRGLCDGLITRLEESYLLWRVVVCDQETSKNEEAKSRYRAVENTTTMGCNVRNTNKEPSVSKVEGRRLSPVHHNSYCINNLRTLPARCPLVKQLLSVPAFLIGCVECSSLLCTYIFRTFVMTQ